MNFCDLSGKSILVTGASSGLGRATAILLVKLNAKVCLVARDNVRLEETKSCLSGAGHVAISFDLQRYENYPDLFRNIADKIGPLNGLAHFAGIRKTIPLKTMKINDVKSIFEVGYFSFVELVKYFTKKGVADPEGGSIVVASSVLALRGAPAMTGYGSSKAAVDGAVRSMACELANRKIRVNSIIAGHVETEMNIAVQKTLSEEAFMQIIKSHPLGIGKPDDIANIVAFLMSDEARWITGTSIPVDGGFIGRS